ncbi:MAG TPA: phosphatase PAP2 family protein [Bacteroidota bacterium]|nr:phosphatase PAP2 family protein [Bacteroidota bacterium]
MKNLRPVDALVILFLAALTIFYPIASGEPADGLLLLGVNAAIVAGIFALGASDRMFPGNRLLSVARNFYPVLMIFIVFKEVHVVIQSMHRADWDAAFIEADRWLFGTDPTVWLSRLSHPIVTEILQISYASYYLIMIALGVELYRRDPRGVFSDVVFCITYGFFLSYAGYIAFPGVGPRFTLHEFGSMNTDLPGLFLTDFLRGAINAGESIPAGAANPMALAQRDVFPSGHTQMTMLTMYFAWKHRVRSRHLITVLGALLIVSTVYLRYHYVVDLLGGALFMAITVSTAPVIYRVLGKTGQGRI